MDEGMIQKTEEWAASVAIKKVIAAALGFLASQKAIAGMAWLQAHGITVAVDPQKFSTEIQVAGIAGFAALHDFLKLKFPTSKWL